MGDDCLNQMMVTGEVYSLSLCFFTFVCLSSAPTEILNQFFKITEYLSFFLFLFVF